MTVDFIRNGAGLKGAAIFANTITPCVWDEDFPFYNFKKSLRWNGFNYTDNYIADKARSANLSYKVLMEKVEIATDTINFKMLNKDNNVTVC